MRLRRRLGDHPRVTRGDLPRRHRRDRVGKIVLGEVARQRGVTARLETRHAGVLAHDPRGRGPAVGLHQSARHLREQTIDLSARPGDLHQTRHEVPLLQTVQIQRRHTHRPRATSHLRGRILNGGSVEFHTCNSTNTQPLLQPRTTYDRQEILDAKRAAFGFRRFAHYRTRALLYARKPNRPLLASPTPR